MASRALGAGLALLAALAFVIALSGGAAPKLVPGWWDGHPLIEGRVFVRKDLHIGLVSAYGCNRGETVTCQRLTIGTGRVAVGYLELGLLAILTLAAGALMRSAWTMDDRRKQRAKAVLILAAIAAVGGALVLALGPQIKSSQRFEVPIGTGLIALWTGIGFAMVAAGIAIRLQPEPLRLRSSQTHKVPQEPKPAPGRPPANPVPEPSTKQPSTKQEVPKVPASASRPPPIPASTATREPPANGAASPTAAAKHSAPPDGARSNAGDAGRRSASSFGRGSIPPPLSAMSFWSQPATPLAVAPTAGKSSAPLPGISPAPQAGSSSAPLPGVAPPLPAPSAPLSAAAPPPLPPAIPPSRPSAPPLPRPVVSALPTIIHAIPPPPTAPGDPPPTAPADVPPPPAAATPATGADANAGSEPHASPSTTTSGADDGIATDRLAAVTDDGSAASSNAAATADAAATANTATTADAAATADTAATTGDTTATDTAATTGSATPTDTAATAGSATPTDTAAADDPSAGDSTSPNVEVPLSTAPASLPPPKKATAADSDLSPPCPQCEAAMSWVEEHLRFYCGECRMYF